MSDNSEPTQAYFGVNSTELATNRQSAMAEHDLMEVETNVPGAGNQLAVRRMPFSARLLLRYKWSILGIFILVAVVSIAGVWAVLVPRYKANAIVEVSPVIPQLLAGKSDMVPLYENYRSSQTDFMTSSVVLNRVLDRPEVQQTNWYRAIPASPLERLLERVHLWQPEPPSDRLVEEFAAIAPKGKQLIFVSMTTPTPGEAKLIVNAIMEEYVKFTRERVSDSDREIMNQLRKEIGDRSVELEFLERKTAGTRAELGTASTRELITQRTLRVDQLESELRSLKLDIAFARQMLADAEAAKTDTPQATARADQTVYYEDDSEWRRLHDELLDVRRRAEAAESRFGKSHWKMVELQDTVAQLEERVQTRETQLDERGILAESTPATIRAGIREREIRMQLMTDMVAEESSKLDSVFQNAEKLSKLDSESGKTQEMLNTLSSRLDEKEMNSQVAASIQRWPAHEPTEPDQDDRWKYTGAALAGALVASLMLAVVRIKNCPTVSEIEEVSTPVNGVFLGRLPLRRSHQALAPEECPFQNEAIRMVRTALLNRLGGSDCSIVHITSATVGSGKSTLVALLGRSLAQLGRKVLLIDADLRRPSLSQRFAIDPTPGLIDLLTDRMADAQGIRATTTIPNLSVLPAGKASGKGDLDLLANGVFAARLAQWRKQYDIILLDSAPLLGVADAAILSCHADGSILVVRERHCRRVGLVEALAALSAAGGKLMGTVFVGSGRAGAYGSEYGYGYGYGES